MKNLFTESLNGKILKYSVVAGAVLASSTEVKGTVQVTTVNTTLDKSSLNIIFDGITKFTISHETSNGGISYSAVIGAKSSGERLYKTTGPTFALSQSQTIPTKTSWATAANRAFIWSYSGSIWDGHPFINSTKYLGVKFNLTDGTHYGWIEIKCGSDLKNGFEVLRYAYEDQPGLGIKAGSTTTLPVELITFIANNLGDKVELKWNTATEENNYGFDIERKQVGNKQYAVCSRQ